MRGWLILSSVLVFGAGCVVGGLAARFYADNASGGWGHRPGAVLDAYLDTTLDLVSREEVYSELELALSQREEIEDLAGKYSENIRVVHRQRRKVARDLEAEIERVLSDDQRQRLASIQARYAERSIQHRVSRDLARIREEVGLEGDQEARVQEVLLEVARDRRQLWRTEPRPPREEMREKMKALSASRDARLGSILSAEQLRAYLAFKEKERSLRKRHGKRHRLWKKGPDEGPSPATAPSP